MCVEHVILTRYLSGQTNRGLVTAETIRLLYFILYILWYFMLHSDFSKFNHMVDETKIFIKAENFILYQLTPYQYMLFL